MSDQPVKKLRAKKLPVIKEAEPLNLTEEFKASEPIPIKKPRASRAKKQPTREEAMQMLLDGSKELKEIIQDLKEDEVKVLSQVSMYKKLPALLKETISNLEEDEQELQEKYEELKSLPIESLSQV